MTPDNKHERQWYEAQKAKVKDAREGATLIYTEGDEAIGVQRGYYVFWMERETPYHDPAYVHQYVGKGDAQTQINIQEWITARQRERILKK